MQKFDIMGVMGEKRFLKIKMIFQMSSQNVVLFLLELELKDHRNDFSYEITKIVFFDLIFGEFWAKNDFFK